MTLDGKKEERRTRGTTTLDVSLIVLEEVGFLTLTEEIETLKLIGTTTLDEIGTMTLDVIEIETMTVDENETTIAEIDTICLEMKESLLETEKMAHQLELAWPIFLKLFHRLLRLLLLIL